MCGYHIQHATFFASLCSTSSLLENNRNSSFNTVIINIIIFILYNDTIDHFKSIVYIVFTCENLNCIPSYNTIIYSIL